MKNSLIIALDFSNINEVKGFLNRFGNESLFVKVGMELFYQEGPSIIHFLKEANHQIFLDLKLHDIPNTVKSAMKGLARLDVDLVNVHAAGGRNMMEAALEGLDCGVSSGKKRPSCIAVTQLTSTNEQQMKTEQLIHHSLQQSVIHYSQLAKQAGLDGVVCSTHEVPFIYEQIQQPFYTVTPGIRMASDAIGDQQRVATPAHARKLGSTCIVVGRSITKANDPYEKYVEMNSEWEASII